MNCKSERIEGKFKTKESSVGNSRRCPSKCFILSQRCPNPQSNKVSTYGKNNVWLNDIFKIGNQAAEFWENICIQPINNINFFLFILLPMLSNLNSKFSTGFGNTKRIGVISSCVKYGLEHRFSPYAQFSQRSTIGNDNEPK